MNQEIENKQDEDRRAPVRRRRRRPRARLEGMTLVEIMIVVIIMALIATGVAVAVLPQLDTAREETTRTRAATIRSAATLYLSQSPGGGCPSVDDLLDEGFIQSGTETTDGWDNDFDIQCEGGDVMVVSDRFDGSEIIEEGEN